MMAPMQGSPLAAPTGRGQHRTPVPDLPLAATAPAGPAVVLHDDADDERIAAVTAQPHEWIVPRDRAADRLDLSGTVVVAAWLARDPTRQRV